MYTFFQVSVAPLNSVNFKQCYTPNLSPLFYWFQGDLNGSDKPTLKKLDLPSTNCLLTSDVHIIARFHVVFELFVFTGLATSYPPSRAIDFNVIIDRSDSQSSVVFLFLYCDPLYQNATFWNVAACSAGCLLTQGCSCPLRHQLYPLHPSS